MSLQKRRAYAKIEAHMATVDRRREELRRLLTDSKTGQLVTPERREILELDIVELAERLKQGTLKPTRVLEAYQVNMQLYAGCKLCQMTSLKSHKCSDCRMV